MSTGRAAGIEVGAFASGEHDDHCRAGVVGASLNRMKLPRLALALFPVGALAAFACSDEAATVEPPTLDASAPDAPTSTPPTPDAGDGAPPPPTTVAVRYATGTTEPIAVSVVFLPAGGEAQVTPIASGQTVSGAMPAGGQVVVAVDYLTARTIRVLQVDGALPGETIDVDDTGDFGAPLPYARSVALFSNDVGEFYTFASCSDDETVPAGATDGEVEKRCVEAGNKVRFLAVARQSPGDAMRAVAASVVDVLPDGGIPSFSFPGWVETPLVTWPLSGLADGATTYGFSILATSAAPGGFRLRDGDAPGTAPVNYRRPPAGFHTGELRVASAGYPMVELNGTDFDVATSFVDRTAPDAPPGAVDLGAGPPRFTMGGVTAGAQGLPTFTIAASAAFPAETSYETAAFADFALDGGERRLVWKVVTTRSTIAAPTLPATVTAALLGGAPPPTWFLTGVMAVSGVAPAAIRERPEQRMDAFARPRRGDLGFPAGEVHAKVSTLFEHIY